jgi:hypothetical protein
MFLFQGANIILLPNTTNKMPLFFSLKQLYLEI